MFNTVRNWRILSDLRICRRLHAFLLIWVTDIDTLPKPLFSSNLIYENRRYVKQVVSPTMHQDSVGNGFEDATGITGHHQQQQQPALTLKRGKLRMLISLATTAILLADMSVCPFVCLWRTIEFVRKPLDIALCLFHITLSVKAIGNRYPIFRYAAFTTRNSCPVFGRKVQKLRLNGDDRMRQLIGNQHHTNDHRYRYPIPLKLWIIILSCKLRIEARPTRWELRIGHNR